MRKLFISCLGIIVCSGTALAQSSNQSNATASTTGPSAWVYVSNQIDTTSTSEVHAWTAGPDGKLTPIAGSPFSDDVGSIAENGKYLFGSTPAGMIDAYRIQSNGSITYAASSNASTPAGGCNSSPAYVFLDHTGASLYDMYPYGNPYCSNNQYQAWNVVKSSGALTYLDEVGNGTFPWRNFTLIGNNAYGYTASCYQLTYLDIYRFKRNSDGSLTQLSTSHLLPKAPSGDTYCPYLAAADPTNHLVIPVELIDQNGNQAPPWKLATYTVNTSTGALSTSSTYANMPKVSVGDITAISVSPSGKLVAVGGRSGLQVFHFNGANPITSYTGLISKAWITDIRWDKNNHLYAISNTGSRLAVFTVTPTNWKWVATYSIHHPSSIAVQPLPLPWQ